MPTPVLTCVLRVRRLCKAPELPAAWCYDRPRLEIERPAQVVAVVVRRHPFGG